MLLPFEVDHHMEKAGPFSCCNKPTTTTKIMGMFSNHTTRIHKQEIPDLARIDLLKLRGEATIKSGKCTKNCSDYPHITYHFHLPWNATTWFNQLYPRKKKTMLFHQFSHILIIQHCESRSYSSTNRTLFSTK